MKKFNWEGYGFDSALGEKFEKQAFERLPAEEAERFCEAVMDSTDPRVIEEFDAALEWWKSL